LPLILKTANDGDATVPSDDIFHWSVKVESSLYSSQKVSLEPKHIMLFRSCCYRYWEQVYLFLLRHGRLDTVHSLFYIPTLEATLQAVQGIGKGVRETEGRLRGRGSRYLFCLVILGPLLHSPQAGDLLLFLPSDSLLLSLKLCFSSLPGRKVFIE
jgi:hypothetical protein